MKLGELGEKAFLSALLPKLRAGAKFINGFGHDASVIDLGLGEIFIARKIDRAGKPVAAINGWTDYRVWGRLAVTANCSDILAVGGTPKGFMLSVSVPRTIEASTVESIIMGAEEECSENGVLFLGGDTKESTEPQVVGAAIGTVQSDYYIGRKAATKGDYLVLAGRLGGFVGVYLFAQNRADGFAQYIDFMAYPKARWKEAKLMNDGKVPHAGMDLSDGLYDALTSIVAPGCGAVLHMDTLPFYPIAMNSSRVYDVPLINLAFGGGDWAMLYAVSPENIEYCRSLAFKANIELTEIGRVIDSEGVFGVTGNNQLYTIDGIINDNFISRMEDEGDYFKEIKEKLSVRTVNDAELSSRIKDVTGVTV